MKTEGAAILFPYRAVSKRTLISIDGVYYRMRRGNLVPIPAEWQGNVAHPQTIRKRKHRRKKNRNVRREPLPVE